MHNHQTEKAAKEARWMHRWMHRHLSACLLFPLSLVFRCIVWMRRLAYRCGLLSVTQVPVPVIVVGNIFVGGTGKTPLVIWLVKQLQAAGFSPGIVSRGYGTTQEHPRLVNQSDRPIEVGDEPLLLAQQANCPVMVGRKRGRVAQALLEQFPETDVIVSDDGLQHYALGRQVEIMLFDERGVGNGWVLPAGPLREPGDRHADMIVVNGETVPVLPHSTIPCFRMRLIGQEAVALHDARDRVSLEALVSRAMQQSLRVVAAAGIGNPTRFFEMLRSKGLSCVEMPLPDHFSYDPSPFEKLEADLILITEKDAVKCARISHCLQDKRIYVIPVQAEIQGNLAQQIVEKCCEYRPA